MKFRTDLPVSGGGDYVKLKDKESITGIFYGEPYDFFAVWEGGAPKEVASDAPGAKFRFRINFIVKDGSAYVVKIFENSKTVYEQLGLLHAEYDLEKTVVKITRSGTEKNTTYNILPLRDPVSPETEKVLKTLKLNEFGHKAKPDTEGSSWEESDEIPF
jgi:hypothetical protein